MSSGERYIGNSSDDSELVEDLEKKDDTETPPEVDSKTTDPNLRTLEAEYALYGPKHTPGHTWGE